jgi:hypothetical protein
LAKVYCDENLWRSQLRAAPEKRNSRDGQLSGHLSGHPASVAMLKLFQPKCRGLLPISNSRQNHGMGEGNLRAVFLPFDEPFTTDTTMHCSV